MFQDMMVFGQGAVHIAKNGMMQRVEPNDFNKLFYGDTDMNEGQCVEICKEQNGYSIEVKKPNGGFDTFVSESFGGMVKHVAKAMNLTDEERNPPLVVSEGPRYHNRRDMAESLYSGSVRRVDGEPTYDELRDELGEVRRISERRKEKLDETLTVNARLVKAESAADSKVEQLTERLHSRDNTIAAQEREIEDLRATLTRSGVKFTKKKSASRKR